MIRVYESGEVYYLKNAEGEISLMNYVEDDMKSADASVSEPTEPVWPEYPEYPDSPDSPSQWDYETVEEYDAAYAAYQVAYAEYEAECDRISEEYDAAKEAQGMLELKINNLKAIISEAKIIDTSKLDTSTVQILSTVELRNVKNKMTMKYTIVSATEADLRNGKISVETPIAKGLLGKKVGDIAEIKVPQGTVQLEVMSISFD